MEAKLNVKAVQQFFQKLRSNVKTITEKEEAYAMAISPAVYADIIDHFEKERGPDRKWKGWSALYTERMIKMGKGGNKILQDTGRLRNSFKPSNFKKGPQGIYWYNDAQTKTGFPYAYAHNEGGPRLPKREFMWLSDKAMKLVSQITANFMKRGL